MSDVEVRPTLRGIVQGTLLHDWTEYPHGSLFVTTDQALFDELRRKGALKREDEVVPPSAIAAIQDQAAEIELLRKQVAELEAARRAAEDEATAAKAGAAKSGK